MANPPPPCTPPAADGMTDDFFEQIFSMPYGGGGGGGDAGGGGGGGVGVAGSSSSSSSNMIFSLGLSLDHPINDHSTTTTTGPPPPPPAAAGGGKRSLRIRDHDDDDQDEEDGHDVNPNEKEHQHQHQHQQYLQHPVQLATLFPPYGVGVGVGHSTSHTQLHQIRPNPPPPPPPPLLHGQAIQGSITVAPQPPPPRPRVRARRGQATDPHSIAERLRRERIAERIRALQELVPNTNKTDRAVMLDEIVDYVKFLRLQVKVLSMSRLGGAGAVAQLVADIPLSSVEGDSSEGRSTQHVWEKWSTDGTERQVAKLMEEDTGAAMQFLQSKSLCIMPISLAAAIYHTNPQPESSFVKSEPNTHS